jgi:TadE-like protein
VTPRKAAATAPTSRADKRPGRQHGRDSGAALVEFALVLLPFSLMLFAMIQFGIAFTAWAQLRNEVQREARVASININALCPTTDPTCCNPVGPTCEPQIASYIQNDIMSASLVGNTDQPSVQLSYCYDNQIHCPQPQVGEVRICASVTEEDLLPFGGLTLSSSSAYVVEPAAPDGYYLSPDCALPTN